MVNGDSGYNARTTRRAVGLLLSEAGRQELTLRLVQKVDTPIGGGFGASAAAATSAVYASASTAEIASPKRKLALCAYKAEIMEQTGLGTVSVVYRSIGAGAITIPGEPGEARFVSVSVPRGTKIVTAFLAPYDKKDALSSQVVSGKINSLGAAALQVFLSDPTLDSLASEGERFSKLLGLESPEVKKMIATAKRAGATYASQNMIGYSIHSLVDSEGAKKVIDSLGALGPGIRVDIFEIGKKKARVLAA